MIWKNGNSMKNKKELKIWLDEYNIIKKVTDNFTVIPPKSEEEYILNTGFKVGDKVWSSIMFDTPRYCEIIFISSDKESYNIRTPENIVVTTNYDNIFKTRTAANRFYDKRSAKLVDAFRNVFKQNPIISDFIQSLLK